MRAAHIRDQMGGTTVYWTHIDAAVKEAGLRIPAELFTVSWCSMADILLLTMPFGWLCHNNLILRTFSGDFSCYAITSINQVPYEQVSRDD